MAIFDDSLSKITTLSLKITLPAAFFFSLISEVRPVERLFFLFYWMI